MNIKVFRRSTCRLCESDQLRLVVPLAPTPIAEKYVSQDGLADPTPRFPLDLYMCAECGHVQLLEVVDPEFLFDSYTYLSGNTKPLVQHFDEVAERTIRKHAVPSGSLVVDIGSNDGSLLRSFQTRGMRVLGVDPARDIARRATESGIPTIPEFLSVELADRIRQEHGPASVVCAFNVYAHSDDLAGMTRNIRALLASDGVFVFEVSYLLDIVDRMLLGTIFHEHLSHHSLRPLDRFLNKLGLQLIDVERNSIQGGSLVGTVQKNEGGRAVSPSVPALLELERTRGLDTPELMIEFAAKLASLKTRLSEWIAQIQGHGKTIWGYGAARSGTTLISQMGLGQVIRAIVDDGPDKVGKFSPGDHIPIRPSQAIYTERPDYLIILAWVHAPRIMANNRAFLKQGGKFLLCFPDLKVIERESELDQ